MEHSEKIPIISIPGTLFGNTPRNFVGNFFRIFPRIYHGNVPRIFHEHIFSRWDLIWVKRSQVINFNVHILLPHLEYIKNWTKSIKGDKEIWKTTYYYCFDFPKYSHWMLHLQHFLSQSLGLQLHWFVGCWNNVRIN